MKQFTVVLAFLMMIGSQAAAASEDGSSSNGHLQYVCNGETHIITSTEEGWTSLSHPDFTVITTYDGFMLTDRETGIERSLGKSTSGTDVMYVYHADGMKRYDCVSTQDETLPANIMGKAGFVIRGIYLGMPVEEFRTSFDKEGYTCGWNAYMFDCKKRNSIEEWARIVVNKDDLVVGFTLRCGTTNSCSFKLDEIVSLLKDAGRFPKNTIELKPQHLLENERLFSTPTGHMFISCRPYGSYDHCEIKVGDQILHPKF